jgi:hypothetical protein
VDVAARDARRTGSSRVINKARPWFNVLGLSWRHAAPEAARRHTARADAGMVGGRTRVAAERRPAIVA